MLMRKEAWCWGIGILCATSVFSLAILGIRWQWSSPIPITHIVQTTSSPEELPNSLLASLLNLKATTWDAFDTRQAELTLAKLPWIEDVHVAKGRVGHIEVDYVMRQPEALLYESPDFAIDQHGVPFPLFPFYTPKRLSFVHLGYALESDQEILLERWKIADDLLKMESPWAKIIFIDVADSDNPRFGKRGIVVLVQDRQHAIQWLLRLKTEGWLEQWQKFETIRLRLANPKSFQTLDLRMNQFAIYGE